MNKFVNVKDVFRKDLIQHYIEQFTEDHLLVLVYIQRFTVQNRNSIDFCMGWLFDDLGIEKSNVKKDLNNALCDLVDWGLIKIYKDIGDRNNINRNTRIQSYAVKYNEQFTQIHDSEIDKILNADIDYRQKKTMLFIYADIASRINSKGYCFPSFESFKTDLKTTSDNRVNDALVALKEYKLIDYANVGQIKVNDTITQGNNIYVLCVDEDYKAKLSVGIDNRRQEYEEGKAKIYKGEQSNKRRSIKQRLNFLWDKHKDDTITDKQLETLRGLEEEYYKLIKNDSDAEDKIAKFVLFNPAEVQQEKPEQFSKPKKQDNVLVGRGTSFSKTGNNVMAGFSFHEDSTDKKVMAIDTFHDDGTITSIEDIINDSKFTKIIQMFAQKHNKKINSIIAFLEDLEDYFISDDFTGLSKTKQYEEFNEILKINESDIDDITNTDSNINYLIG